MLLERIGQVIGLHSGPCIGEPTTSATEPSCRRRSVCVGLTHAASRQRSWAASQMLRAANWAGACARARSTRDGVPGASQGTGEGGTDRVHRGRGSPVSSASFSAMPARSASNAASPVRLGGDSMASAVRWGCARSWSRNPRRRAQFTLRTGASGEKASVRLAIDGPCVRAVLSVVIDSSWPDAAINRESIVSVGSVDPASMRDTVEVGTPALAASALRDSPASCRARLTSSPASMLVAYMQHREAATRVASRSWSGSGT